MNTPAQPKPYMATPAQLQLLQQRGMHIAQQDVAARCLESIGYYRLSGYWYPYREYSPTGVGRLDTFVAGADLDLVVRLYDFDRRLKLLVLEALERIEICVRVQVAQVLGVRSPLAYTDTSALDGAFVAPPPGGKHAKWLDKLREAQSRSREDYVQHHGQKYGGQLPVWVVVGLLDFGGLSTLYSGLKFSDRTAVVRRLQLLNTSGANAVMFQNWLRHLNYVRNVCAHHSRLWNTNMTVQLREQGLGSMPELTHLAQPQHKELARVFGSLSVIAHLNNKFDPGNDWPQRVKALIASELAACGRSDSEMGFPPGWTQLLLWR